MNKKIITLLSVLVISACGGGGDGSGISSVPPGIYAGTITATGFAPDDGVGIITSDNRIAVLDLNTEEGIIGTINGSSIAGTLYSSSVVPATAEVTSVSGNNISGTYSSSLGGGTFAFVSDPNLYNRGASLSKLEGIWVDDTYITGTGISTWTIQVDGSFIMTSVSGCAGSGSFSLIDPTKNEYNIDITVSNCIGANGSYSGIGVLNDTFITDDTLSFTFSNGAIAGIDEAVKQ